MSEAFGWSGCDSSSSYNDSMIDTKMGLDDDLSWLDTFTSVSSSSQVMFVRK